MNRLRGSLKEPLLSRSFPARLPLRSSLPPWDQEIGKSRKNSIIFSGKIGLLTGFSRRLAKTNRVLEQAYMSFHVLCLLSK
jgi:hypothetical protein